MKTYEELEKEILELQQENIKYFNNSIYYYDLAKKKQDKLNKLWHLCGYISDEILCKKIMNILDESLDDREKKT